MIKILYNFFNFVLFTFFLDKELKLKGFDLYIKQSHLAVDAGRVWFAIMPNIQNQLLPGFLILFRQLWEKVFFIRINQHRFYKSSLTCWTIY